MPEPQRAESNTTPSQHSNNHLSGGNEAELESSFDTKDTQAGNLSSLPIFKGDRLNTQGLTSNRVFALQRLVGNRVMERLLRQSAVSVSTAKLPAPAIQRIKVDTLQSGDQNFYKVNLGPTVGLKIGKYDRKLNETTYGFQEIDGNPFTVTTEDLTLLDGQNFFTVAQLWAQFRTDLAEEAALYLRNAERALGLKPVVQLGDSASTSLETGTIIVDYKSSLGDAVIDLTAGFAEFAAASQMGGEIPPPIVLAGGFPGNKEAMEHIREAYKKSEGQLTVVDTNSQNVTSTKAKFPDNVNWQLGKPLLSLGKLTNQKIIIPHPGREWIESGLAINLEAVLGQGSTAYILTDNDKRQPTKLAEMVLSRSTIQVTRNDHLNVETTLGNMAKNPIDLGGVPIRPTQPGPYSIIEVQPK